MKRLDYWSVKTNPETGTKFEAFLGYLRVAHNGNADIDAFIDSEYGEALAKILHTRFTYEEEPMGEGALAYFTSLGLKKVMYEDDDYYTRWEILTPLAMDEAGGRDKRYPLVIANHGGSNAIETEELCFGFPQIAAQEGFMVAYLQNTNWQNVDRVLGIIAEKYPLDEERVYLTGYSQGGYQVTSTYFRIPQKLTAVAPCGNDIYRTYDNFNIPYTDIETENLRKTLVPFMQVVGCCEASSFVPVNDWKPRKDWGYESGAELYLDPRRDDERDPTRIIGGRRRFSDMTVPPEGVDVHRWMIERLNMRLYILQCDARDPERCIAYLNTPEDELHHILGFYGDAEKIESYYGYKHYISDIWNADGINAFRYVAVENSPHWVPVMTGPLVWDFFRQFRRDRQTGKIITEEYQYR
ncbi:MAG: hypothetical protein ACRDBO_15415 [Lachnospiraceae bacterium]